MLPITHVRMERESTDSWITFKLDEPVSGDLEPVCNAVMPDWEWVSGAMHDPDNENGDFIEPWRDESWDGKTWESPIPF